MERKIKDYIILETYDISSEIANIGLRNLVKTRIFQGYIPLGGVSVNKFSNGSFYSQAMVQYEDGQHGGYKKKLLKKKLLKR